MSYFTQQQQQTNGGRRGDSRAANNAGRQIVSPTSAKQQQQQYALQAYQPSGNTQRMFEGQTLPERSSLAQEETKQQQPQQDDEDIEETRLVMEALANNKCICDICTCGRHHCPSTVHLQARYDPNLASSYKDSFVKHQSSVQRARAPPTTAFASGEKFEGASVTKSDFAAHHGARPAPLMRPAPRSTVGGDEGRDFRSENASNYVSHGFAKREASIPAHTMHVSNEPFLGQSTTKEDFQRWSAKPADAFKPQTNAAPTGPDDRDFATENGSKFNAKGYVARQPAIPFTSHVFENEPFAGESSMKTDFKQWNVKPSESFKPKYNSADVRPDDREFRTEKQDNFTNKGHNPITRMTAPPSRVLESAPFQGASVTKSDYAAHHGARPAPLMRPAPRTTVGGDEGRDFRSENASNYVSHGFAKREASIPAHTMHVSNEPFLGQSTTKEDFQRWSAKPADAFKPQTNAAPTGPDDRDFATENGSKFNAKGYVARQPAIPFTSHVFENEPFAGESSMKTDFKQWNVKPSESFKPKYNSADVRPDDREFRTEKQDNFTNKGNNPITRMTAPPSRVLESAPFQGASVTKSDYAAHHGARPAPLMRPAPRSTVGGDEGRDFRSENASNYVSHGFAKREASIPAHTMHVSNEPFLGQSTTKEDFQRWSAKPADAFKPQTNAAPTGPDDRDFATENGSKFNAKGYVARQPAIPFTSHVFENTEDRSFETEASQHYTAKPLDPCPSDRLVKGGKLRETKVVAGHLLYHHDKDSGQYVPLDKQGKPRRF